MPDGVSADDLLADVSGDRHHGSCRRFRRPAAAAHSQISPAADGHYLELERTLGGVRLDSKGHRYGFTWRELKNSIACQGEVVALDDESAVKLEVGVLHRRAVE